MPKIPGDLKLHMSSFDGVSEAAMGSEGDQGTYKNTNSVSSTRKKSRNEKRKRKETYESNLRAQRTACRHTI